MRGFGFAQSEVNNSRSARGPGAPRLLAVVALVYLAAHLPFLARSLEDIDSINFALGLRDFDVAAHQPHPPGYPVYIALGRVALSAVDAAVPGLRPATGASLALALLSAIGGALAIAALGVVFVALDRRTADARSVIPQWWWATVLAAAAPLFWISGVRPMSDMVGLAFASVAMAVFLSGDSRARLVIGAALVGLGGGLRVQTTLLTLPVLAFVLWRRGLRARDVAYSAAALAVGGLAWAVPLVWLSGGMGGYLAALGSQAGEDFAFVDMLWANPAPRRIAQALMDTFVSPWGSRGLAGVLGVMAALGTIQAVRRERPALLVLAVAFLPYAVFHLLFQETSHVRYALPLVAPVAWLASRSLVPLGRLGPWLGVAVVASSLIDAVPAAALYAAQPHPAFRVIDDMAREAAGAAPHGVFSHYALYRSLQVAAPPGLPIVAPTRNQEWLGPVNYWRRGGRGTVWFLADPRRTDLALYDPRAVFKADAYPWDISRRLELGGTRPVGAEWYRLSPPDWVAGEGWSLTPEAGGRVRAARTGLSRGPIEAFVKRQSGPVVLVVGGYYLGPPTDPATSLTITLDGAVVDSWTHDPQASGLAFLHVLRLPDGIPSGEQPYATLRISSRPAAGGAVGEVAIRQFDLQPAAGALMAFGSGWHEDEVDPSTGRRWRWTSDRADLFVLADAGTTLIVQGESPLRYFDAPPTVRVTVGAATLAELRPNADFEWRIAIPPGLLPSGGGTVTLSLDRVYLPGPAEGTSDTRRLGLRVFDARLSKK